MQNKKRNKLRLVLIIGVCGLLLISGFFSAEIVADESRDLVFLTNLEYEWNLVSIPHNTTINKTDLYVNYDDSMYTWDEAANQQIILNFLYYWDEFKQLYNLTVETDPKVGYWVYAYESCELWGDVDFSGYGINGTGTQGYIAKFIDTNTIENSVIYQTSGGNVGIGTSSPSVGLEVEVTSGGAASFGYGNSATGEFTIASGYNSIASGNYGSTAIGYNSRATGNYGSTAIGYDTNASGINGATAFGNGTTANGTRGATAIGWNTTASGIIGSTALGAHTIASGFDGATAIGRHSSAIGRWGATAVGTNNVAQGDYGATALGANNLASGNWGATSLGADSIASGNTAIAIGRRINVSGDNSVGISLDDPVDEYQVTLDNVMSIMGGKVGIGTNTPNSELEVNGIVHSTADGFKFPDGSIQTTAASGDNHSLNAADGSPIDALYVNNDGDVGIGTTNPTHLLQVGGLTNSLGTVEGDTLSNLQLYSQTGNHDKLDFTTRRFTSGSNWLSATQRIQRQVDATQMGYIQFGNPGSNGDLITFGENEYEYMRINGNGNIGIGTENPNAKLDVEGDVTIGSPGNNANGGYSIALGSDTNATGSASLSSGKSTNAAGMYSTAMGYYTNATGDLTTSMGSCIIAHGQNSIGIGLDIEYPLWNITAAHVMAIMGGKVGVGITSPENILHVNGTINLDPTSEPSNPSTGFVIYCDSADGKLKTKSSSGTVTVLANP